MSFVQLITNTTGVGQHVAVSVIAGNGQCLAVGSGSASLRAQPPAMRLACLHKLAKLNRRFELYSHFVDF